MSQSLTRLPGVPHCVVPHHLLWLEAHFTALPFFLVQCAEVKVIKLCIICFRLYLNYIMRCVGYLNHEHGQFSIIFSIFLFKMAETLSPSSDLGLFGAFTDASVKKKKNVSGFCFLFMTGAQQSSWEYSNILVRRHFNNAAISDESFFFFLKKAYHLSRKMNCQIICVFYPTLNLKIFILYSNSRVSQITLMLQRSEYSSLVFSKREYHKLFTIIYNQMMVNSSKK